MYPEYKLAWLAAFSMGVLTGERYAILNGGPMGFAVIRSSIALKPRFQEYVIEVVNYD